MSQYLDKIRDVDPNDSEAVKDTLTAFFQNLPKNKTSHCEQWLNALENVINRFPKYCGQHRGTIENHLVHFLNSTSYYTAIIAGKCAHSLQQVRPPQEKSTSAKSCWREQMNALCEASHTLIDALFTKSTNHNVQKKTNHSDLPLLVALEDIDSVANIQDVLNKTNLLSVRLRNILVFIQAMLVEIYPVAKPIRPQLILEVILRSLSASGNDNSNSESVAMIKVQALRTLDALVSCLGSNIIPFSSLVFRIVMQTLRWSSDNISKESSKVRIAAYNTLTNSFIAHRMGQPHQWDGELTNHIINDITPEKHVIQLTTNAQPMKNLSKKARKKLANTMLRQSNIASHMPGERNKIQLSKESNDEIAMAALECAESFLTTCGIFLTPTIHKQFQEEIIQQCYNIDTVPSGRVLSLLRVLECSRNTCGADATHHCATLYALLVNEHDHEISKFCSQALLNIRMHLHCSPPSLNFVVEPQPKKRDERKRMSDRNRAVLESLLGQERMPSEETTDEEIITIPDEPSNKRPRIEDEEEISDKISLSSDSQSSIEISDSTENEGIYYVGVQEKDTQDTNSNTVEENSQDLSIQGTEKDNVDEPLTQITPIHEAESQIVENSRKEIFEVATQVPLQVSNDTVDGEKSPVSMEVAYGGDNAQKVAIIEKLEDENLPSTNETDDIQITCGQQVKSSQDDKNKESVEEPKENGIKSPEKIMNGYTEEEIVPNKLPPNGVEVTVEDMLADFVDEVNEDTQITPA